MKLKITVVLLSTMIALSGCTAKSEYKNSAEFFAMDTIITAKINDKNAEALLKETEKIIADEEQILSKTIAKSDLSKLNSQRTLPLENLSKDSSKIINKALEISAETQGNFDVSLGVLSELWGFSNENPTRPSDSDILSTLKKTGYKNIEISDTAVTLNNGIELDFGGIAKGYVTDLIVSYYKENGVTSAMLSLGGNVYVLGTNNEKNWRVGISDPAAPNELCGVLSLQDKAVVTSGDYQRYFDQDSKRYHHILDPKTGFPAENDLASVTVVADNATLADGYSTAFFVMGYEKATKFIEQKSDIEAVFVKKDGEIICTEGIAGDFSQQ